MQKFTFTVDVVGGAADVDRVVSLLASAIQSVGDYRAVTYDGQSTLGEQGLKVWAKRRAGISLAAPKPVRKPRVKKEEVAAETVA